MANGVVDSFSHIHKEGFRDYLQLKRPGEWIFYEGANFAKTVERPNHESGYRDNKKAELFDKSEREEDRPQTCELGWRRNKIPSETLAH